MSDHEHLHDHTHPPTMQPIDPGQIKYVNLTGPMFMLLMLIVLTIVWGWSNRSRTDKVLERLEAIEQKIDAIKDLK